MIKCLRQVFTSDGVGIGVVRVLMTLVKIKNGSRKWSHKRGGIGVRRTRMFPFLPLTLLTTPSLTFRLWSRETRLSELEQKRKNKPITKYVYVPILLLPTLTISFSLDHKQNVSDRGGEWYLEKCGSRKILAGSRNLGNVFDKSRSLVFSWFVFTFFESRNFFTKESRARISN